MVKKFSGIKGNYSKSYAFLLLLKSDLKYDPFQVSHGTPSPRNFIHQHPVLSAFPHNSRIHPKTNVSESFNLRLVKIAAIRGKCKSCGWQAYCLARDTYASMNLQFPCSLIRRSCSTLSNSNGTLDCWKLTYCQGYIFHSAVNHRSACPMRFNWSEQKINRFGFNFFYIKPIKTVISLKILQIKDVFFYISESRPKPKLYR